MTSDADPQPLAAVLDRLRVTRPGLLARGSPEYEQAFAAERLAQRTAHEEAMAADTERHLIDCGVPARFRDGLLGRDGPRKETAARAAVVAFMADPAKDFLVLIGTVGNGKSEAACSAFLHLRQTYTDPVFGPAWQWGAPGAFVRVPDLATGSHFGEDRESLARIARAPLVVIDELGGEPVAFDQRFADLIDQRWLHRRKTVITANLSREQFQAYPARALDRIRQRLTVVESAEPSFRTAGRVA